MDFKAFGAFLYKYFMAPPECVFCGDERCSADMPVCNKCFGLYSAFLTEGCADCGDAIINCSCFDVKNCTAHYYLFNYGHPLMRRMIYRFKARTNKDGAKLFAKLLLEKINTKTAGTLRFDCVSFVPRSKKGKRRYGFDQGRELAKQLARLLDVPCKTLLINTGEGDDQKRLARSFRGIAAKLRFGINRKELDQGKLTYRNVLLVDDILTTGASMSECAALLKKHGVKRVFAAFIAHTPANRT